jgi:hypothetical protein
VPEAPSEPPKDLHGLGDQINALPVGTPVKALFVLEVKTATIHAKNGEGMRELTFKVPDVASVLGFTDRPQRYAFNLTVPALDAIWSAGKDSFAKNPPNAIIKDSRSRVAVTEVAGFSVDGDTVKLSLNRTAFKSVDAGDLLTGEVEGLTLFIDSSWLKVTGAGLSLGLQQAAKACVSVDCEFWPLGA